MKLHLSNGSPFARKVRILLMEKGLPFDMDIQDGLRPTSGELGPTLAIPVLEDGAVKLWDAGTEVNQEPFVGADQAARQAAPNTGAAENGVVQSITTVTDGFTYPSVLASLKLTITNDSGTVMNMMAMTPADTMMMTPEATMPDNSMMATPEATMGS